MTNLTPGTDIAVNYSGAAVTYDVIQDGILTLKGWGGGGAGGTYFGSTRTDRKGGAGGRFDVNVRVKVGDVVKIEVGQGGQKPESVAGNGTAPCNGGPGGWPDGGYGGRSSANTSTGFGGGGGSTRVYVNDILVAIAGGGGGSTGYYHGGPGGGTSGGQTADQTSTCGTGGTQSAGGIGDSSSGLRTKGNGGNLAGGYGGASRTVAEGTAGGGGGGGWYGGGSNKGWTSGNHGSGGGGSGQIGNAAQGTLTSGGLDNGTPSADAALPEGCAVGGACATTLAAVANGGNGFVTMKQVAATTATLATGANTISFTGAAQSFTAPSDGTVTLKMWGGGGSGGSYLAAGAGTRLDRKGGAGGQVTVTIPVVAGDVLKFEIGEGGRKPDSEINGARGGWPDGGNGARYTLDNIAMGSGGGSSRVYLNGVLVAIAGAGGGSTGYYHGGPGGGTTGGQTLDNTTTCGTGGTQSAGGADRGASLQGANGGNVTSTTTASGTSGSGGGGGYYGGGTNKGSGVGTNGSGGGGSSYIKSGYTGTHYQGGIDTGDPHNETERPSTVAKGGSNATTLGGITNGGDGYAYAFFDAGSPGDASGNLATATMAAPAGAATGGFNASFNIGTVAMTSPAATASGGITVNALLGPIEVAVGTLTGVGSVSSGGTGSLGTVTMTAPEGVADTQVNAFGSIPTVDVQCDIIAGPVSAATVIIDLAFDPGPVVLEWTPGDDEATGEGVIPKPITGAPLAIGVITMTPPQGEFRSPDAEASGDLATITLTAPEGYAAEAYPAVLDSVVITTNLITATVTGAVSTGGPISILGEGGVGGIQLTPPQATPRSSDMLTPADIGTVIVETIRGVALAGDDVVLAVGMEIPPVAMEWTNTEEHQGTGQGNAVPPTEGSDTDRWLKRVVMSAIQGSATGAADKSVSFDLTITFAAPQAITQNAQSVLAPIGIVYVRRALGWAGENPSIEGDALAGLDLTAITVTTLDGYAGADAVAQGDLGVIMVLPAEADMRQSQSVAGDPGAPIRMIPADGQGWAVDPASTASADLTALVVLTPPEGYYAGDVTASGPLGVVRVRPVTVYARRITLAGEALLRRVENGEAILQTVVEKTAILRT